MILASPAGTYLIAWVFFLFFLLLWVRFVTISGFPGCKSALCWINFMNFDSRLHLACRCPLGQRSFKPACHGRVTLWRITQPEQWWRDAGGQTNNGSSFGISFKSRFLLPPWGLCCRSIASPVLQNHSCVSHHSQLFGSRAVEFYPPFQTFLFIIPS